MDIVTVRRKWPARMNMIHEVGLYQGRLGFTRAIVMLEEGCNESSNTAGLGQIRFPRGTSMAPSIRYNPFWNVNG
jgi:predicted nucleotide-binding protein